MEIDIDMKELSRKKEKCRKNIERDFKKRYRDIKVLKKEARRILKLVFKNFPNEKYQMISDLKIYKHDYDLYYMFAYNRKAMVKCLLVEGKEGLIKEEVPFSELAKTDKVLDMQTIHKVFDFLEKAKSEKYLYINDKKILDR